MTLTQEQFIQAALLEFERPLVGYAYGFLRDWDRARDVVQDTFIRLCQQDQAKVRDALKTWLYTVCRNRALDVLRKEARMVEMDEQKLLHVPSEKPSPAQAFDSQEVRQKLDEALERLTPHQREVIVLKFQQGLSYEEISRVTGLSSGNVGFLLHHGLKRLREWLPREWSTPSTPL
jgi:RNA polymerase sigma-70 factor (ECF subfamily)